MTDYNTAIDEWVTVLTGAIDIIGKAYSPLTIAAPLLKFIIRHEAERLKTGLADGTIVPDGQGGFVPVTNSKYDPTTGQFL